MGTLNSAHSSPVKARIAIVRWRYVRRMKRRRLETPFVASGEREGDAAAGAAEPHACCPGGTMSGEGGAAAAGGAPQAACGGGAAGGGAPIGDGAGAPPY